MSNAWKNGPQDPPFVIADPQGGRCITFDPDDKLGSMYMLDHDFKGCVTMGVSKEVIPESGCVLLDGQKVPHVVKKIQIMSGFEVFSWPGGSLTTASGPGCPSAVSPI